MLLGLPAGYAGRPGTCAQERTYYRGVATAQTLKLTPEQVTAVARAVAEPRRFAILQQIAGQETIACGALFERQCISPATLSHHLKELLEAGLVASEREGRGVRLTLRREVWEAYLRELSSL